MADSGNFDIFIILKNIFNSNMAQTKDVFWTTGDMGP